LEPPARLHDKSVPGAEKRDVVRIHPSRPIHGTPVWEGLSEAERAVLDCLHTRSCALTAAQLGKRAELTDDEIDAAVASLLDKRLIARLNTVVTSYASRFPGIRVYNE
jgi:hypothetical protein